MKRTHKFCIHLVQGNPKGCLTLGAFKTDHKEYRPWPPSVWGREQMTSQLPWRPLETGSVWTQLMDDPMDRVAASSCPYGATVIRVPHPEA